MAHRKLIGVTRFTPAFKETVVLSYLKKPIATRFACEATGLPFSEVADWVLRYKQFGYDGLKALDQRRINMVGL